MPQVSPSKRAYWLHLVPIESKEVLLLAAPVSGPGGASPSAKYPSFQPLRLLLAATTGIQPVVLDEADKALTVGKPYGIYHVILTKHQLGQLGLLA
jgi:hypothetical protein